MILTERPLAILLITVIGCASSGVTAVFADDENRPVFERRVPNREAREGDFESEQEGAREDSNESLDEKLSRLNRKLKVASGDDEKFNILMDTLKLISESGDEARAKSKFKILDAQLRDECEKARYSDRSRAARFLIYRAHLQLAYGSNNNSDKAIEYFEQALREERDPRWEWHYQLAKLYHDNQDMRKAETHFRKALLHNSYWIPAEFALAKIYSERGDINNANLHKRSVIARLEESRSFLEILSRLTAVVSGYRERIIDNRPVELVEQLRDAEGLRKKLRQFVEHLKPPNELVLHVRNVTDDEVVEFRFIYVAPGTRYIGFDDDRRMLGVAKLRKQGDAHFSFFGLKSEGLHEVNLTDGFYILDREVTRRQWQTVLRGHSATVGPKDSIKPDEAAIDLPMQNVSWIDAMTFCRLFESHVGIVCRLPSEWEWECAARQKREDYFPWGPQYNLIEGELNSLDESTCSDVSANRIYQFAGSLREWCLNEHSNSIDVGQTLSVGSAPFHLEFVRKNNKTTPILFESGKEIPRTRLMSVRGGSCHEEYLSYCQTPVRSARNIADSAADVGFRPILLLRETDLLGEDELYATD